MAIEPPHVRFEYSETRKQKIQVWRLYPDDDLLLLDTDPDEWILSNPADCLSVLILELVRTEKIDSVSKLHNLQRLLLRLCDDLEELPANLGDLGSLTYLSLKWCESIESLPNSIGKLSNLTDLCLYGCESLKELPANMGDLKSLTNLCLDLCWSIKSLPNSIGKLSNLTALHLNGCESLKELPVNVDELSNLSLLNIQFSKIKWLPWSNAKLSKLSLLLLPTDFRLETLPSHLNDSVVISVKKHHARKTWAELKTEINLFSIPVVRAEAAQLPSTPGYLQYEGDPAPWIQEKGLYSLVRILDLNLQNYQCEQTSLHSIGDLPMLTHLYISKGCLSHLPVTLTKITHLSLYSCKFKCYAKPRTDSLGKLSTLQSLELFKCANMPARKYLPVSLTHLTLELEAFQSLSDSCVARIRQLSNFKSLALIAYKNLDLSLLNSNLVKLKIWSCSIIKSLPAGLRHLEIIHSSSHCRGDCIDCDNLVNLVTLSVTCRANQSFRSIEELLNLQELHLKDCFNLRKFPPNMDKLVNLRFINVSGTRIKSLPDSITNLHNLRHLILPRCFAFESLSENFKKKVMVITDETEDFYYDNEGYRDSRYDSSEDSKLTSGSIEEDDRVVLQESEHEIIEEQASPDRPMNSIPNVTQVHEGSHFSGRIDQIDNVFSSSLYHEKEILPAENEDCVVLVAPDKHSNFHETYEHHIPNNISQQVDADPNGLGVSENTPQGFWRLPKQPMVMLPSRAANPNSNPYEITFDESNPQIFWNLPNHQPMVMLPSRATNPNSNETILDKSNEQAFQNRLTDNSSLEIERRNTSFDSRNPVHDRSNEHALVNDEQKIVQKIEITREHIEELMSQNMRLVDAAEQLDVSRSTLKRKLKEYKITWETEKKRKQHQNAKSKKQNNKTPSGGNFLVLDSLDSANQVGHDRTVEHLDGMNHVTLSDHRPSEGNVVYNSTLDAMRRIVEQPSSETQCPVGGCHQQVEEHRGVNECTLSCTVQPNGVSSSFVVKATYDGDTVKIQNFSLSFSIEQLKEEVGKKLGLEVGKFKLKYLDEDNDWIIVSDISDLGDALGLSRSSGRNFVKLKVELSQCNN